MASPVPGPFEQFDQFLKLLVVIGADEESYTLQKLAKEAASAALDLRNELKRHHVEQVAAQLRSAESYRIDGTAQTMQKYFPGRDIRFTKTTKYHLEMLSPFSPDVANDYYITKLIYSIYIDEKEIPESCLKMSPFYIWLDL